MNGREGGFFSRDILKPVNGRWIFYDSQATVKVGDTLYYWTYVDYHDGIRKLGYTNDDREFIVSKLLDSALATSPPIPDDLDPRGGTNCSTTPTKVADRTVCGGELIFEEHFKNFRDDIWTREYKFAGEPDFEFVIYSDKPEVLQVKRSRLRIKPMLAEELYEKGWTRSEKQLGNQCTGIHGTTECAQKAESFLILPPVASAQISTKGKFSFKYGKVEIRAKLPKGDWIYPQLFLNSLHEEYGPGYASGQIRVAFVGGTSDAERKLLGGSVVGKSQGGRSFAMRNKIKKGEGGWCDGFHRFGVTWRPDQITLSVDGVTYGNVYPPQGGFIREAANLELGDVERWRTGSVFAPFDKEMYLAIGVGVGGHSFENSDEKPWKKNDAKAQLHFNQATNDWYPTWSNNSALEIDYIKIWAF